MPKVTSLKQQRTKDRLNLFIDGEFYCGINTDTAVQFDIQVGKELSDEELVRLLNISGENDLYRKALVYILKAQRTEHEITKYLYRKEASPETVARIVARLKTMDYINDEAYAKMFTEQKMEKLGEGQIRNKLYARGIAGTIIKESLESVEPEGQEQLARAVGEKYVRTRGKTPTTMQKLYRYLASKGFDLELCKQIVEELKSTGEDSNDKVEEYQNKYSELRLARQEAKVRTKELKAELKKLRDDILGGKR